MISFQINKMEEDGSRSPTEKEFLAPAAQLDNLFSIITTIYPTPNHSM